MAGDERAGILDARLALQQGLGEVTDRRRERDQNAGYCCNNHTHTDTKHQFAIIAVSIAPAIPPANPSQVFFGLISGAM